MDVVAIHQHALVHAAVLAVERLRRANQLMNEVALREARKEAEETAAHVVAALTLPDEESENA